MNTHLSARVDGLASRIGDPARRWATFGPRYWSFLRFKLKLHEAEELLQRRLAAREDNLLHMLRAAVYGHRRSPYRALLEWADCEYGDVERMVRSQGLEGTLAALHRAGVYVTFDEFKGRTPIVRHGRSLAIAPEDFDNPLVSHPVFYGKTGGSTGPSTRVPFSWEHQRDMAVNLMLFEHAHGLIGTRVAFWFGPPDTLGVRTMLHTMPFGEFPDRWFTRPEGGSRKARRPFIRYFLLASRLAGAPVPEPETVALEDAEVVARWAARTRDRYGASRVFGYMSQMVRVALAASAAGLDLMGVTLMGSGEPPTPAKIRTVTGTGARWVPTYYSNEADPIGFGCAAPIDENDLHLQRDRLALIQQRQDVPGSGLTVDAFCLTSLLRNAPKVLLNTEFDDYGVVERRSCGCPLEQAGLIEHVRDVRSYRKLTGEAMTLVGTDIERILEDVLPARFGGTPIDYQLMEEEDAHGLTRLYLLISPSVHIADEDAVADAFLQAVERVDGRGLETAQIWRQAESLRVRRREPIRTGAGKLMPLAAGQTVRTAREATTRSG